MSKHTRTDLYQMQSLPLSAKIRMSEQRIQQWYDYWDGDVYISFSGGKDSTVLVDIATKMGLDDIPLMFVDTGLEYPEIREFVKSYGDRVVWLKPKKTFREVCTEFGFPFISKEVSNRIYAGRKGKEWALKMINEEGEYKDSLYGMSKYKFMLDAPFDISDRCCYVMKKSTSHKYAKETGRKAMLGMKADESRLRLSKWLKEGCNAFNNIVPTSNPISFWTEQDTLKYIADNNLPIASVYGKIVRKGAIDGQMYFDGMENEGELECSGVGRTGCIFCGFGCHIKGDKRFLKLKESHPQIYDYIFKPESEGGLGYKEKIDWINEHGGFNVEY